jgi:hypothetical protein
MGRLAKPVKTIKSYASVPLKLYNRDLRIHNYENQEERKFPCWTMNNLNSAPITWAGGWCRAQ